MTAPTTKHICILLLWLGICVPTVADYPPKPAGGTVHQVRFIRAIDGDTAEVEVYYTIRIRLIDCWAPEIHETRIPGEKLRGFESKKNLETYVKPGDAGVVFIPEGVDHSKSMTLNRYLAYWWTDDFEKSLNEIQVDDGHAWRTKEEEVAAISQ